jgi:hypothetical protein
MKRTAWILRNVALTCALVACGAAEDDADQSTLHETAGPSADVALDVNDVSVLFPLDKSKLPLPQIGMDLKGSGGSQDLFPLATMTDVASFQRTQKVTSLDGTNGDRANWRVVGFRFDPCAQPTPGAAAALRHFPTQTIKNLDSDLPNCTVQIRLIAQPFVNGRDVDTTAHLVFSFGDGNKTARDRIIGELQKLKASSPAPTSGVPLGVHPGLQNDGTGAFAGAIKEFLAAELSQAQLVAVASMGTQNGDPWIFSQGTVDRSKHWSVAPITGFGVTLLGQANVRSQRDVGGSTIDPPANPGENDFIATTTPLFKGTPTGDTLDLAHKVNNPTIAGLFNTDCISCHTATERTINKHIDSSQWRFSIPKGVTGYVEKKNANTNLPADEAPEGANQSTYNFRNFGYFFGQATISYRTANETAMVVDHINRDVLHKSAGPGPVCDDAKVWTCFRDGKSSADCLTAANGCSTGN